MSYSLPHSESTVSLNSPETAVGKQSIYGKSMFGGKSERLPRITLYPASFYGCDPITLYEPPKNVISKMAHCIRAPFRRQPQLHLGASYDSFSKPPSWLKNDGKESIYDERKPVIKKRRCVSAISFCLGFFIASASVFIAVATVLTHKRLIERDDIVTTAESANMAIRQQPQIDPLDPDQSSLESINLFNSIVNNRTITQRLWTQLEEGSLFTTKPKSQGIEIEPRAMRPMYNAAVPYNGLPWSILKFSDLSRLCFTLQNPKKDSTVMVKITRMHHTSTSKNILVERSVFNALAIGSKGFNTTVIITAQKCVDTNS
ncbi:hypothetical protein BGW37DRAFT_523649 [Umbelopsis sp. PMI_123]|nr:hypothetical protein BGW37DRAFT_523649 [Umbelopsis sp. PMI_123]